MENSKSSNVTPNTSGNEGAGANNSSSRRTTAADVFDVANDELQAFKWILDRTEEENDVLYSFLKRQLEVFDQTRKDLEKITQKTSSSAQPALKRFEKCEYSSLKTCIDNALGTPAELAEHLKRFVPEYEQQILAPMSLIRESHKTRLRSLRNEVKSSWAAYSDIREGAVPKLKKLYLKQAEELEISRSKDQAIAKNLTAVTKAKQDLKNADYGYRLGIQMLEDRRQTFIETMNRVKAQLIESETERAECIKKCFLDYSKLYSDLRTTDADTMSRSRAVAAAVTVESDAKRLVSDVEVAFPIPAKVLFDHPIAGYMKDLVFGISLRNLPEAQGPNPGIPHIVEELIRAIEKNGLLVEGVYRISGRVSETEQLRIAVEKDAANMSLFFEPSTDVHCLTGLMKAYFRELPEPVFVWELGDRLDHMRIPNQKQRLANLRGRIKQQCPGNKELLRRIVAHLALVASNSATNKMTISNLARIWSTLIFSSGMGSSSHPLSHSSTSITSASQSNLTSTSSGLAGLMRKATFYHSASNSSSGNGETLPNKFQYNLDDQQAAEMAASDSLVEDLIYYYNDLFSASETLPASNMKPKQNGDDAVKSDALPVLPRRVADLPDEPVVSTSRNDTANLRANLMKSLPPPPTFSSDENIVDEPKCSNGEGPIDGATVYESQTLPNPQTGEDTSYSRPLSAPYTVDFINEAKFFLEKGLEFNSESPSSRNAAEDVQPSRTADFSSNKNSKSFLSRAKTFSNAKTNQMSKHYVATAKIEGGIIDNNGIEHLSPTGLNHEFAEEQISTNDFPRNISAPSLNHLASD